MMRADPGDLHRLAGWVDGATLLVSAGLLFLAGVWLVCRLTRSTARAHPGRAALVRTLAAPLVAVGSLALGYMVPVPTDVGSWVCGRCGSGTRELRYLDLTLWATSEVPRCEDPDGLRSSEGHAWAETGCHSYGRDVGGATSAGWSYPPY